MLYLSTADFNEPRADFSFVDAVKNGIKRFIAELFLCEGKVTYRI